MVLMSYSRLKLCVVNFCTEEDGQKLLAIEQMDCSRAGLAQASPLVPMAVVASMAPMASTATMVPEAVSASLAPKLTSRVCNWKPHQEKLMDSESLRRVD